MVVAMPGLLVNILVVGFVGRKVEFLQVYLCSDFALEVVIVSVV
jgi:hypothetical protein